MGTTYTPMGNRDRDWYTNRHAPSAAGEYQCVDGGLGVPQIDNMPLRPASAPVSSSSEHSRITVTLVSVFIICFLHVLLGLVSVAVGVTSSIQADVWLAHTVSPIWSGVFVSSSFIIINEHLSTL